MRKDWTRLWDLARLAVILIIGGGLWVGSGYLLHTYTVLPLFPAYSIFPLIAFGIVPYAEGILKLLFIAVPVGGVGYATGYFFENVLKLHPILAYNILPAILILSAIIYSIVFPLEYTEEEK